MIAFCAWALAQAAHLAVEHDDVQVARSAVLEIPSRAIEDSNGDGVVQIATDGVTVDFAGAKLCGADPRALADSFHGVGIRITAKNVTVKNAVVFGFKTAIWATHADGLVLDGCDVSGNWCQRLKSTEKAEDGADWLWPHENDQNQWLEHYGAGIYVEESRGIRVVNSRASHGQNGLLMRRVVDSDIVDNDFSFLSGWGIGMFRCERDRVLANACDFCVRGYSHGVYSRGQDSAGILFFEQNVDNLIAFNSATHSGDGFFGFAGKDALEGAVKAPGVANVRNLLYQNDFSFAPAIGIEMTFSFENQFVENRLNGSNYGIWGGYSSRTSAFRNEIADNELAGIAIEHGSQWTIAENRFAHNARGIQLWWDNNRDLLTKPWAKFNRTDSAEHILRANRFDGDALGIELRGSTTEIQIQGCTFQGVGQEFAVDSTSTYQRSVAPPAAPEWHDARLEHLPPMHTRPVGARAALAGRDKIIVTEWGPYDWKSPYLQRLADEHGRQVYRVLGVAQVGKVELEGDAAYELSSAAGSPEVRVAPKASASVARYRLRVAAGGATLERAGVLCASTWSVSVFPWTHDPRTDLEGWHADAKSAVRFERGDLRLPYASAGPSQLPDAPPAVREAKIPTDHFGTLAETRLTFPEGAWRITTTSDDGVRVWFDDSLVIDHWDWHPPAEDHAEIKLEHRGEHRLRVEHFELDGYSTLALEIEPAP